MEHNLTLNKVFCKPESMGTTEKTAYLRELNPANQCELMFSLRIELEKIGLLEEQIRAVRSISDTVGSLLQHTVNKINHLVKKLKSPDEENDGKDMDIQITLKDRRTCKPIKSSMTLQKLIKSRNRNLEFCVFNHSYVLVMNAPFVKEIKLPVILYANFEVQATKLSILFAQKEECKFSWFKSKDKVDWTWVGEGQRYRISDDDVGCYLKLVCVPYNKIFPGPPADVISENKVEVMGDLPSCPFEKRHAFTTQKLDGNNFRVVSYNVLANRYAETNDQFPYCSLTALAIDYRKQLIGKELLGYQADIICLQEVDNHVFKNYYKELFKENGYMSFYHKKGNKIPEGLACFFNKSRFKKMDDRQIVYSNEVKNNRLFTYLWDTLKANADLKNCFMKQMTSLHITTLRVKSENQIVIVANTHLYYHPEAELVRILQANIATTYLTSLCRQYPHGWSVSVIFCGDFNCKPSSVIVEYMLNGKISKSHQIFENTVKNLDLFHNFKFESACGFPKYTNYTHDFKDCLDYIYIDKNKIRVKNVVPFPTEEELSAYTGLPNDVYPSDHLALVADLEFI